MLWTRINFLERYLFQSTVLLKPDSNCFNSFLFSWVDKVIARTWHFLSVILNVGTPFATVAATRVLFLKHVNWRVILELIEGISSVLQKLLRYFNGTIISSFFVPTLPVCPPIYDLNLNELLLLLVAGKSIILPLLSIAGSSL